MVIQADDSDMWGVGLYISFYFNIFNEGFPCLSTYFSYYYQNNVSSWENNAKIFPIDDFCESVVALG